MASSNDCAWDRRTVLFAGSAVFALPGNGLALLAQAKPTASPDRNRTPTHSHLAEVVYAQDGTEIRMRVRRSGAAKSYTVEVLFIEGKGTFLLQTKAVLNQRAGTLGTISLMVEGQKFFYNITIDASQVPIQNGQAPEGAARILVRQGNQTTEGSFDLNTWTVSGLERARGSELPAEIGAKLNPFEDIIRLSIQRDWKRAEVPPPELGKPPARLWTGTACRMTCWGIGQVASVVSGVATGGVLAAVAGFAFGAASSFCSDRCPA